MGYPTIEWPEETRYATEGDIREMFERVLLHPNEYDIPAIVADTIAAAVRDDQGYDVSAVNLWKIIQPHQDPAESYLRTAAYCHARLVKAENKADLRRSERRIAINGAIQNGVTMYAIAKRLGISEQAVAKIRY